MSVKLLSGQFLPLISFGTFQLRGDERIFQVIDSALSCGYRSFDTAAVYANEISVGAALRKLLPKYNLTREDVFITTKLSPRDSGDEDRIRRAVQTSLNNLGLTYIDLYLIHWPGMEGKRADYPQNPELREKTWSILKSLHKQGTLRSIGVSNYNIKHLEELLKYSPDTLPSVNQVEWHPHYHQDDLLEFCQKYGIVLQAYSPLGSSNTKHLLSDSTVKELALKYSCSPAQILIKWSVDRSIPVAVKASSHQHIEQNFKIDFLISKSDLERLNRLCVKEKYAWNPDIVF